AAVAGRAAGGGAGAGPLPGAAVPGVQAGCAGITSPPMTAPFRIVGARGERGPRAPGRPERMSDYLDKLMKMIPGEIVGLYLVGSGMIPQGEGAYLLGWSLFCLAALFAV